MLNDSTCEFSRAYLFYKLLFVRQIVNLVELILKYLFRERIYPTYHTYDSLA